MIAELLAAQAPALAAELLPNGHREGREWVAPSLTGTSLRSTSVCIFGSKAGVWCDFSDGGPRGDLLSLVAHTRTAQDVGKAIVWANGWLRLGHEAPASAEAARPAPTSFGDDETANRDLALKTFLGAQADLRGTPVLRYLSLRGIDLSELGRYPRSLRFAPRLFNRETGDYLPAMVAAVRGPAGGVVAVHRTWLADREGGWRKAALRAPKMTLGSYVGGCIPLWRGPSAKPLDKAPAGEEIAIGEGIETCLSVVVACPELRVLCAVSLSNMARLQLPDHVGGVILLRDADGANRAAQQGFERAVEHFTAGGHPVRVADPPTGKDFNDTLQAPLIDD